MSCPECKVEMSKGAGWCKYCGEDIARSQHRLRHIYYFIVLLVLVTLLYFFVVPNLSFGY